MKREGGGAWEKAEREEESGWAEGACEEEGECLEDGGDVVEECAREEAGDGLATQAIDEGETDVGGRGRGRVSEM